MAFREPTMRPVVGRSVGVTLLLFALVGVILILASVVLPDAPRLLRDFPRELGVVLVTVCSDSMIYEVFVATRHFAQLSELLRQQIAGGKANAAICERLGIARLYPTRKDFQTEHPLLRVAQSASPDSRFRMVAKSLFLVLIRGTDIKEAVKRGAKVVLCCIASARPPPALSTAGLVASDTEAAPARFRHDFGTCLTDAKPTRSVYIRYHSVDLFDCYFTFHHAGADLTMWHISFGADSGDKRKFLLDSTKGLGVDLERRYPSI